MDEFESIADKLKSLGVQLGIPKNFPATKKENYPIETVIADGYEDITPFGTTFISKKILPQGYQHGNTLLSDQVDTALIQQWAKFSSNETYDLREFVFLDTETSGLAGGTGTYPFMVGLGYYTDQGFIVHQLFMRSPQDEQSLLSSLSSFIESFKVVVTFNGKSFDVPILNSRHVLNGVPSPFKKLRHIDLLHLSRRIWRNRLKDRSLGSLESEILETTREQIEIPGWLVPKIYYDYLRSGDARPLEGVFYHNTTDIISLAALMNYINNMLLYPIAENKEKALDMVALAQVFEKLGYLDRAIHSYEAGLSQGLPINFFVRALLGFAHLYRKQGNWEQAKELWEKAAEYQQTTACIELAKYYEHVQKDYKQAQYWTDLGLEFFTQSTTSHYKNRKLQIDLVHRLARIKKKIQDGNQ
ncbi:MAG: hypothetical protein HPY59_10470 [Anaerolineae bacterium]|nr:hypothetical protein [Anaerolineae bacterium]